MPSWSLLSPLPLYHPAHALREEAQALGQGLHMSQLGRAMLKFTQGKCASRGEGAGSGPSFSQMMDAVPFRCRLHRGGRRCLSVSLHTQPHPQLRSHRACGDLCTVPLGNFIGSRGECSKGRRISCCWQWDEDISALPCPPITGMEPPVVSSCP